MLLPNILILTSFVERRSLLALLMPACCSRARLRSNVRSKSKRKSNHMLELQLLPPTLLDTRSSICKMLRKLGLSWSPGPTRMEATWRAAPSMPPPSPTPRPASVDWSAARTSKLLMSCCVCLRSSGSAWKTSKRRAKLGFDSCRHVPRGPLPPGISSSWLLRSQLRSTKDRILGTPSFCSNFRLWHTTARSTSILRKKTSSETSPICR
mmetsp:Transcript_59934/g.126880  ORF Transcript_59934/g.126880 Transcript_59934/m.126880 type:complete len:209 (-) Transcript_59934:877-1503(-)